MVAKNSAKASDFENLLGELDTIVERMEKGEQSLDQTMKDFERGMTLSEQCQKSLDAAQLRVDKLVKKHDGFALESMEEPSETDEEDYS